MDVDGKSHAAGEALDRRHGPGLTVADAACARGARREGELPSGIHSQDRATPFMVPRQAVAQPIRQGEHPLADRHVWQHGVDEGIVWYSEPGVTPNTIVRFDPNTKSFETWPVPSGGGVIRHMVATPGGNLYIAGSGVNKVGIVEVTR